LLILEIFSLDVLIDGRPVRDPISGSAVFVLELVKALALRGTDPTVFVQSDRGRNGLVRLVEEKSRVESSAPRVLENLLIEYGWNPRVLRQRRGEVGHETYFARLPGGRRCIATIHDVIPLDHPEWFSWRNSTFARRNFHRQMSTAATCVFSSRFTMSRALEHGDPKCAVKVVPLAASDFLHAHRGSYVRRPEGGEGASMLRGIRSHSFVLVVGNIEPRKNLPLVAAAVAKVNAALGLDLQLVIAGRSIYGADEILKRVRAELGHEPIVTGFVPENDKLWLYQNCACHVYASRYEGFGLPPVESIVVGTPTVMARGSSIAELIPSPTMGFDSGDADGLAVALEHNLFMSSHDLIGERTGAYVDHYRWSRVAEDYMSVYAEVGA